MDAKQSKLVIDFMDQADAQATKFAASAGWTGDKANDCISAAYEAVCKAVVSYDADAGPFPNYAARAVRNALITLARDESRHVSLEDNPSLAGAPPEDDDGMTGAVTPVDWLVEDSPGPEELLESDELIVRLYEEMERITADEQETLLCLFGLGEYDVVHTTREAAAVLGISEASVRRTRDRALRKLEARI